MPTVPKTTCAVLVAALILLPAACGKDSNGDGPDPSDDTVSAEDSATADGVEDGEMLDGEDDLEDTTNKVPDSQSNFTFCCSYYCNTMFWKCTSCTKD